MLHTESERIQREFSQRLNKALDEHGIPTKGHGRQQQTAKLFGVSQKGARRWLEGIGLPRARMWNQVAQTLHVRMEWLFFNLGPMRRTGVLQDQPILPEAIALDTTLMQRILMAVDGLKKILPMTEQQKAAVITSLYASLFR